MEVYNWFYYLPGILALAGIWLIYWDNRKFKFLKTRFWSTKIKEIEYNHIFIYGAYKRAMEKKRQERINLEIYEAISFMRNITIIGEGEKINADSLLEQLIQHKGILSPTYANTLRLLRQNQKSEALKYFSEITGTKISNDFIRMLIQWDNIHPKQLLETLLSHQKSIKEARITIQKRRDETVSDLIYFPVVINMTLVFINFIYVAYYINQKEMLTMLL